MTRQIFTPFQSRGLKLRNRIVVSPMLTYASINGHVNDTHLAHYGKFAAGGAGLVFVESTKVHADGRSTLRDLGLWSDEFIKPLGEIAALIKHLGAAAGIQIGHSGRKALRPLPWEAAADDRFATEPSTAGVERIAPSPVRHSPRSPVPREMTLPDIKAMTEAFGAAARRADKAGFDVLEIHGGHGYLIHQFLSPQANQRTDSYGGTLSRRMRFAIEVASCVRKNWPVHKPLFFRLSAVDDAGWDISHSVTLAKSLKDVGVDVFDCSSGGIQVARSESNRPGPGYQVKYSGALRNEANVATMAVGLIVEPEQAEEILVSGQADLVALGREFLYNPNWPLHAARKLRVEKPFAILPQNYEYWLQKRAQDVEP